MDRSRRDVHDKSQQDFPDSGGVDVGRRRLMRVLAASGGAIAFSAVLPETWIPARVEIGALSAHAAVSPVPRGPLAISDLSVGGDGIARGLGIFKGPFFGAAPFTGRFTYSDSKGAVGGDTVLDVALSPCEWVHEFNGALSAAPATWGPTSYRGAIDFEFNLCLPPFASRDPEAISYTLCVNITAGGRLSNTLCSTFLVSNAYFSSY